MGLTYFKRYQMQLRLPAGNLGRSDVGRHYRLFPWDADDLEEHAEAKWQSFCQELDACIFPCLSNFDGCNRLMREITARSAFLPEATWLVRHYHRDGSFEPCGTVQCLRQGDDIGAVQNLGVAPNHRGMGLGSALLRRAIRGVQAAGLPIVHLEVTAENTRAVRFYQRLGFRAVRTVYKAVEVAYS